MVFANLIKMTNTRVRMFFSICSYEFLIDHISYKAINDVIERINNAKGNINLNKSIVEELENSLLTE